MYLINVNTFELEEFSDDHQVPYAILSHRWQSGELEFQDTIRKQGHRYLDADEIPDKIRKCCAQAARDGLEYVWIDTCCINKTDGSKHEEAVNSMFNFYKNAKTCYSYLSDVPEKALMHSEWWKRGWTLQELLAPQEMIFFDTHWAILGRRSQLAGQIGDATGIPVRFLSGEVSTFENLRLQAREVFSWACNRRTTRAADVAYSLLGLLDIQLPLTYGLRQRSFLKLQEAIFLARADYSIFAWDGVPLGKPSLLADSPARFSTEFTDVLVQAGTTQRRKRDITPDGISLEMFLIPVQPRIYIGDLGYSGRISGQLRGLGIFLKQLDDQNHFARIPAAMISVAITNSQRDSDLIDFGFKLKERTNCSYKLITVVNELNSDETKAYFAQPAMGFSLRKIPMDDTVSFYQWTGWAARSIFPSGVKFFEQLESLNPNTFLIPVKIEREGPDMFHAPSVGPVPTVSLVFARPLLGLVHAMTLGFTADMRPCCILSLTKFDADSLSQTLLGQKEYPMHSPTPFQRSESLFVEWQGDDKGYHTSINSSSCELVALFVTPKAMVTQRWGFTAFIKRQDGTGKVLRIGMVEHMSEPWDVTIALEGMAFQNYLHY